MANKYFIYRTDFDNTIIRETATDTSTGGTEQALFSSFNIPIVQPVYLWKVNGANVIPNSDTNVNAWLNQTKPAPTSADLVTVAELTGVTATKLDVDTFTGYTTTTGLAEITAVNATTTIESSFNGGLVTNVIRPTGDTQTAIRINKADGITNVITVNTASGFTGFNSENPKGMIYAYGTDTDPYGDENGMQRNRFEIDGPTTVDKDVMWSDDGKAKWAGEMFRDEKGEFFYFYNIEGNQDVLVVSEAGHLGINTPSNIANYHTLSITGSSEGVNVYGLYDKSFVAVYQVRISDTSGVPNQYQWRVSKDLGDTFGSWSASSGCTTGTTLVDSGIEFYWGNISGYTLGDAWEFNAFPQQPIGTFVVAPNVLTELMWSADYTAPVITYADYTAMLSSASSSVELFNVGTTNNALFIGTTTKNNSIFVNVDTLSAGLTLIVEYWNGTTWVDLSIGNSYYSDGTANLVRSGIISWNSPLDWVKSYPQDVTEYGYELYWIRLRTVSPATIAGKVFNMVRGSYYRMAAMTNPLDVRPAFYVDALGRTNIGGGNITGRNVLQINKNYNIPPSTALPSLVEIDSEDSGAIDLRIKLASNDAIGGGVNIGKTRGTLSAPLNDISGDTIGHFTFRGIANGLGFTANEIISKYTGNGTTRAADLIFYNVKGMLPVEMMRIDGTGVGFGQAIPTAQVQLQSGGTAANTAALKFTTGSLLSTPEIGAVEFNGDKWFGTVNAGRKTFAFEEEISAIGLNDVTAVSACTNIESYFNGGLVTQKIRPTGNTTTAIQVHKADGTTVVINVDTVSGFTGFGTDAPTGMIHMFGRDVNPDGDANGFQSNKIMIDGVAGGDRDLVWGENGEPMWIAEIYRDENGKYWYLYNGYGESNQIVASDSGRMGINNRSNIVSPHVSTVAGTNYNGIVAGGLYDNNFTALFKVKIDSTSGTTDTFVWCLSKDLGDTFGAWSAPLECSLTPTLIDSGVEVSFVKVTGNTVGDTWRFATFTQLPIGTFAITPNKVQEVLTTDDITAGTIIYTDITGDANTSTTDNLITFLSTGSTNAALYIGGLTKISSVSFNLVQPAVGATIITEYWNGTLWVDISVGSGYYTDTTFNLQQSGSISWNTNALTDWGLFPLPDRAEDELYWIRFRTVSAISVAPIMVSVSRNGQYRLATMTSAYDYRPSFSADSFGRVNIGGGAITGKNKFQISEYTPTQYSTGLNSQVEFDTQDSDSSLFRLKLASDDNKGYRLGFGKYRGSLVSGTSLQTGDSLGNIIWGALIGSTPAVSLLGDIGVEYVGDGDTVYGDMIFKTNSNVIGLNTTEKLRISENGTGFGGIIPTARIEVQSGSTTVAPLKFRSGALLSAPQIGAVEFNGTNWYGTNAGGRKTFAFLESPQFTGAPNLPSGTTFATNSILGNYILISGGSNNNSLTKLCSFNTYVNTTAPATYYNKTQINSYTGATATAIGNKLNTSTFSTYTGTTVPNNYYNKTQINSYTGATATAISNRLCTSTFSTYTGTTVPNTYYNKTQINTYTGATATAIGNKLNTSTFSTYTGTTVPNSYYNKTQINTYTGATNTTIGTINSKINYISGVTDNKLFTSTFSSYTGNTQPIIGAAITCVGNGLTKCSTNCAVLGGALSQNVNISGGSHCFTVSACEILLRGSNSCITFELDNSQAIITDSRTGLTRQGLVYAGDYSLGFANRSLVDKEYVDNIAGGLQPKAAVVVATVGDVNLTSAPASIDGVTLSNGMRVLVKNQTSGATNGIYDFNGTGSAMTRSSDFDGSPSGEVTQNTYAAVLSGNTNAKTSWILQTPNPITVGVTSLTFVLFSSSLGVQAGNGICVVQSGGNAIISTKLASNSALISDGTGLYVNSGIAGNSLSWSAGVIAVNISGGTLSTALGSKLNTSTFSTYTGTTVPNNYYNKTQINTYTGTTATAIGNKLNTSTFSTYTGTTVPNNYYNKTQINSYTGATATAIGNKLNTSTFSTYTGTTVPNNYYNKTQINTYTGATATAIGNKLNTSTFSTYTGTTVPNTYYNKTQIGAYTGKTQAIFVDTLEPTGFINQSNIVVTYNNVNRTVTLSATTGSVEYYWRGTKYSLGTSWTSAAHTNNTLAWYLYSVDGINFAWSNTGWKFSDLQVVFRPANTNWALTEIHGTMPSGVHREFHQTVGTYKESGFGLTDATYTLQPSSPINSDNTPAFNSGVIVDEDLETTISAWNSGSYTTLHFTGTETPVFVTGNTSMFRLGTIYPKYNVYSASTFSEVTMLPNNYANWYVVRIPVTNDTNSQKFRAVILQPQFQYTSLISAQGENTQRIELGGLSNLSPEFVLVERITLSTNAAYTGATGRVRIEAIDILSTTKFGQVGSTAGVVTVTSENVSVVPVAPFTSINMQTLSNEYAAAIGNRLCTSTFNTWSGSTLPNNYYSKTQINSYTGATATAIGLKANITSPTFLVSACAPTPAVDSNNTCIATAAFVVGQAGSATPLMDGTAAIGTSLRYARQDHRHASDTGRTSVTLFNSYTGTTAPATYYTKTQINSYTGATATAISNRLLTSTFNTWSGSTLPANYYNKTQINTYTGATATAIGLKANITSPTFLVSACAPTPAVDSNNTCIATAAFVVGQAASSNPLVDGSVAIGTSLRYARQDHVHPTDTSRLSTGGGTLSGTLRGTIFSGGTCVTAPITCGSTCVLTPVLLASTYVCSPIITGSTKVCSPIVFGTTCVCGGIVCATTISTAACSIGTTCSCSPVVLGSTCVCSPIHCGACTLSSSYVCSPILTGSTKVCTPIACGTTCVSSPVFVENGTCLASTYAQLDTQITGRTTTTLVDATYAGKTIEANGTFTITFPNGMHTGMMVDVINVGTGAITLAASTTINAKGGNLRILSQYAGASVYHRGSNVWVAVGDLVP